ncbi:type II toxin-antitoxin system VapC family toxin [uncultured Rhodoblastus sp.]|uniref:type II toxin-antitoxin system VapC family toxin n=1 Tax=uncultured Rhodoblastus sp. TaxID=543037 RepID=UPI0025E36B4D|nr:type II toxin-antitoxin system VapC family toxin [uncultured Rhodoblastus sp.]
MIVVDTNILVDIAGPRTQWRDFSREALARHFDDGPLIVNSSIFAEFSLGFDSAEACEAEIALMGLTYQEIPRLGLFLAGRAFKHYRRRGGSRSSPLPDFFIGGHASALGAPILTRDVARYRTYFPEVRLFAPK